jgi:hypothetical protein
MSPLLTSVIWMACTAFFFSRVVLPMNEVRWVVRVTPRDPVLELPYSSRDCSNWISWTMVGCTVLFLTHEDSHSICKFLLSYSTVVWCKGLSMFLLPLELHPLGLVLVDPILEICGGGERYVRDLFFSGHVSFLCCLALFCTQSLLKLVVSFATVWVSVCLLWMRAHYTVDILVAPLVSFAVASFFETHDSQDTIKSIPNGI